METWEWYVPKRALSLPAISTPAPSGPSFRKSSSQRFRNHLTDAFITWRMTNNPILGLPNSIHGEVFP
ncbi:hypothetical protein PROFUN_03989 [Planoprotostelium fungivorum]|uniref:Uncharacterized protein n=1 Tax=Planoprotostelium fungivorum TaxID=1890364 RepID=A0A2P6NW54_9EUKA|nr:hypothetical protein PROFUN_03989 [Planoprotostelium fungivorum]